MSKGDVNMSYEDMHNKLLNLPSEIRDLEEQILKSSRKVLDIKEKLKSIEVGHEIQILHEQDETGKPKYTNAEKRNVAFYNATNADPDWVSKNNALKKYEEVIQDSNIELKYLNNIQSNIKTILRHVSPK